MKPIPLFAVAAFSAISLSACAQNYAAEGALGGAAAGAAVSVITGTDLEESAAVGAALGGAAGYFIDKDKTCDGYDRNGRLDDDCYGRQGYPQYRPR